jgi:hypothetical protein
MPFPLAFGLDTFGDVTHDDDDRPLSHEALTNIELYGTRVIPLVRELLA